MFGESAWKGALENPTRLIAQRLHATSLPFFRQITKVKPSEDPYPPAGSGKDKILHTEALGLVMIDHGGDIGEIYGVQLQAPIRPS